MEENNRTSMGWIGGAGPSKPINEEQDINAEQEESE